MCHPGGSKEEHISENNSEENAGKPLECKKSRELPKRGTEIHNGKKQPTQKE